MLLILNDDYIALGHLKSDLNGRRSASLPWTADKTNLRKLKDQFVCDFLGMIGGSSINDQDFETRRELGQQIQQVTNLPGERRLGVVGG